MLSVTDITLELCAAASMLQGGGALSDVHFIGRPGIGAPVPMATLIETGRPGLGGAVK